MKRKSIVTIIVLVIILVMMMTIANAVSLFVNNAKTVERSIGAFSRELLQLFPSR